MAHGVWAFKRTALGLELGVRMNGVMKEKEGKGESRYQRIVIYGMFDLYYTHLVYIVLKRMEIAMVFHFTTLID